MRVVKLLERRGLNPQADPDEADALRHDQPLLFDLYGASVTGRIATGARAGQRVRTIGGAAGLEEAAPPAGPRCASASGVSVHANGGQATGDSGGPDISANGRFVTFWSRAENLVSGDSNLVNDVFVHDRKSKKTKRVSVATGGAQANDNSHTPAIDAKGKAVVFVRAAYIPENQFDGQLAGLSMAGYRAIAPYRAGSGPSDLDRPMSRAKDADDVFALVDHLGIKKFVISGHCGSLGVVRQIYLSRPERIVGVIAIEGGAFGGRCKLPAKFRNNPKVARQRLDKEMLPLFDKNRQELAPLNRLWDHPSNYNTALLKRWKSKTNRRRRGRAGRSKDPRDLKNPENKFFCKVPLLVIAAGRGRMRLNDPRTIGFRNSMRSKDATFVLITNAGHWVFSERPKPTNKAILAFLARLPSTW